VFILLNGPLGIGKSTLAEALTERLDGCAMLDGDHLVAVNPPAPDAIEHLHSAIAVMVEHHRRFGYRHFAINHLWQSREEVDDLCDRLRANDPAAVIHCFLLSLPEDENRRRIERRQGARAIDEQEFESVTNAEERRALAGLTDVGEPFDVSGSPEELAETMLRRLGLA
jgi:thymidylate kinase